MSFAILLFTNTLLLTRTYNSISSTVFHHSVLLARAQTLFACVSSKDVYMRKKDSSTPHDKQYWIFKENKTTKWNFIDNDISIGFQSVVPLNDWNMKKRISFRSDEYVEWIDKRSNIQHITNIWITNGVCTQSILFLRLFVRSFLLHNNYITIYEFVKLTWK